MPRPNTKNLVVDVPEFSSPVTGVGVCGTSYDREVVVRSAYQHIDRYEVTLPPITSAPPTSDEPLPWIAIAIATAQNMIDGTDPSVKVRLKLGGPPTDEEGGVWSITDVANRNAIQHLIDRAKFYLGWARALWDYWAIEWRPVVTGYERRPTSGRLLPLADIQRELPVRWPLDVSRDAISGAQYGERCALVQGGVDSIIFFHTPSPNYDVRVACPSASTVPGTNRSAALQHMSDRQLFRELASAALLWARCAQEAAAAVGIHHRNRRDAILAPPDPGAFAPLPPAPPIVVTELGPLPPHLPPPPIPDPDELEGVSFPSRTARTARKQPVPWGKVALGVAGAYAAWRLLAR